MLSRPDILVLGGGGVLGETWMTGFLGGIEDANDFDLRRCEYFVGTSAGAIVASELVAGHRPERPSQAERERSRGDGEPLLGAVATTTLETVRRATAWALALGSPLAPAALELSAPSGRLLRATVLRTLPRPRRTLTGMREHVDRSGARFDGRLRVIAVDRRSGRRVVFGRPGAPPASVGQAVEASCTVPWLYAPVWIDGREYVDGGIWSPTNLDSAPAGRSTHVLCLSPMATITALAAGYSPLTVARRAVRVSVPLEELALRRRGAAVQTIAPDRDCAAAMGPNLMDREPRERVLAAGYAQGQALATAR